MKLIKRSISTGGNLSKTYLMGFQNKFTNNEKVLLFQNYQLTDDINRYPDTYKIVKRYKNKVLVYTSFAIKVETLNWFLNELYNLNH